jgi:hypothetical protein
MCLWIPTVGEIRVADDPTALDGREWQQKKLLCIHPRRVLSLVFGYQLPVRNDGGDCDRVIHRFISDQGAWPRSSVEATRLLPAIDEDYCLPILHTDKSGWFCGAFCIVVMT